MFVCMYVCILGWCVGVYAYSIALNPIHELEVYVCTVCLCFAIIVLNMYVCMYVCLYVCMYALRWCVGIYAYSIAL